MRKDYKTVNDIQLGEKKDYLLKISRRKELKELIFDCLTNKQFELLLSDEKINKFLNNSSDFFAGVILLLIN